jgi:hypothetical protein
MGRNQYEANLETSWRKQKNRKIRMMIEEKRNKEDGKKRLIQKTILSVGP